MNRAGALVVGSGIAGAATAFWLAARFAVERIVVVDQLRPLSLTTAASGENFRCYWPQPALKQLSERSVDLMEALASDHNNSFGLRFSGYEFVSERDGIQNTGLGSASPGDLEVISDLATIQRTRPHLSKDIRQVIRVRRAGALDVNALGSLFIREAKRGGAKFVRGEVIELNARPNGGFGAEVRGESGVNTLLADQVVLAAGPFMPDVAAMIGIELPIENFLQHKIVIPDPLCLIPRDMPFTIFADRQRLNWSPQQAEAIAQDAEFSWLLDEFPAGLHIKPESGNQIKLGWAFNRIAEQAQLDPPMRSEFAEITLRGASRFIPGLEQYVENMPQPVVQFSGYYSRTPENLPLIGPLGVDGAFTVSALSGFGTMVACAAGELCAKWITGASLPEYARALHPSRYQDLEVMEEIGLVGSDGQL